MLALEPQVPELMVMASPARREPRVFYSNHNVGDIVDALSAEDNLYLIMHYFWRALHCPGAQPGDIVFVSLPVGAIEQTAAAKQVDAEQLYKRYLKAFTQITAWMKVNVGINYVITDNENVRSSFAADVDVQDSSYYPGGEGHLDNLRGASFAQVEPLNHKGRFGETMEEVAVIMQRDGEYKYNFFVPQERVFGVEEVIESAAAVIENARELYAAAASAATEEEWNVIREHCKPGAVIRMALSGGGFGTIFIRQEGQEWKVTIDKESELYATEDEALAALSTKLNPTQEYVVSRFAHVVESPSLGVYVDDTGIERQIYAMPYTIQFMEEGSCIGGASQTALHNPRVNPEDQAYMQTVAQRAVEVSLPDKINETAHFGFDDCTAGEGEQVLANIFARLPELGHYAKQVAGNHILVESNTRYTSLSLSVQPVAQFVAHQEGRVVDWELMQAIYGMPTFTGEVGGFAVWDYLKLHTDLENPAVSMDTEEKVLEFIDRFNDYFYQRHGIFLLPRIGVEQGIVDEKIQYKSSAVIGMRPNADPQAQQIFKLIVEKINKDGGLAASPEVYFNLLTQES